MAGPPQEITIRPLRADDWQDCYEVWRTPSVLSGTLGLPSQSEDEVREMVANCPPNLHRMAAVVGDKVVGMVTMGLGRGRRSHVGSAGISVHDDYQRQGIGTALMEAALDLADNWLNLRRLELEVMVDNQAALSLYRTAGCEVEGRKRADVYRAGQFVDVLVMGPLREEVR